MKLENNKTLIAIAGAASAVVLAGASIASAQTAEPVISSIMSTPTQNGATITWTTDENANSQVEYGTSLPYTASTTLDSSSTMNHSETVSNLAPNTTYHFAVMSTDASSSQQTSADQTFMTLASPSTTTGTSTDISMLQSEITALQNEIATLQQQIASIMQMLGMSSGGTTTPAVPSIDQNGQTAQAGGTIDFGGRNFAHNENVVVSLNGTQVGKAFADGGGNFSTGSMMLPATAGTYTYTFVGASGNQATATVTVK